jgi:ankyrin repeat protein
MTTKYTPIDVYNLAASYSYIKIVEMLLDKDIDINIKNNEDNTALHLATDSDIVKMLLDKDIDINSKNNDGAIALHLATDSNIVKMLLDKDIDINSKNNDGEIALHLVARSNHINIVEILLDRGININNSNGFTALHIAAKKGNSNVVEILLARGIDINSKTNVVYYTALHLAALKGHSNIVEMLLNRDININSKTNDDRTALHWAANGGFKNCVEMLLNRADIQINDDISEYALDLRQTNGNTIEIIDCRSIIFAEVEHRRKRALFDSFINHHIEYQPYINSIYTLCYPTGNIQVAKPPVGWIRAEAIRDKYYFDEILFYLHMHIANVVLRSVKKCNDTDTDTVLNTSVCSDHFASSSNKTFTLMKVLADRLKEYLKPKKIELCYSLKCSKEGTKKCSRCHTVYYCSLECQKSHWKRHKLVCKSS